MGIDLVSQDRYFTVSVTMRDSQIKSFNPVSVGGGMIPAPTSPLLKSAPVLQGLHFEWPKLVDNSYLPLY